MDLIYTVLPLAVLAGLWFLLFRAGSRLRRPRKMSAHEYAKTHSLDEVLAKFGTVPQPASGSASPPPMPGPIIPMTSPWILGPAAHEKGAPEAKPFGYDLDRPDSRTIPTEFHGTWVWESKSGKPDIVTIEAERYQVSAFLGMQPVVGIWRGDNHAIAIVSQVIAEGKWNYSLQFLGLLEGGTVLTDMESMDMQWRRS